MRIRYKTHPRRNIIFKAFEDNQALEHKGNIIYLLFEAALVEGQNFRDPWPSATARREVKSILQIQE